MNLQQRISILVDLGKYMLSQDPEWQSIKQNAFHKNIWFTPDNIDLACKNIVQHFLQSSLLENWASQYSIPENQNKPLTIGLVMAGNIPLVGFHDFLSIFITGHKQRIKLSSKDAILLPFLWKKIWEKNPQLSEFLTFEDNIKGCDAYIATGSNNSGRYFDYYFSKYPSIIRRNRTSVAILDGKETTTELTHLVDDIQSYFGLGCRNITMLYVPKNYDFIPLIQILKKNEHLLDYHKYKNNYDYQLAILLLNKKFYMSGGSLLLEENPIIFSAISTIHYQFYDDAKSVLANLEASSDIQAIVGHGFLPFGQAQIPSLTDYADGVDTMHFLAHLS